MAELFKTSFGLTFERQSKAPLEDKRLFDTFAQAQAYVNNVNESAYIGMTISVIADIVSEKNGLYYVASIADDLHNEGTLFKVGNDITNEILTITEQIQQLQANVVEIKVKDIDNTPSYGVSLTLDESGKAKANVDIDTLAANISAKHIVTTDTVTTTNVIGKNDAGSKVQTVLEDLHARITAVVSNSITSIIEGEGIRIDDPDSNTPRISVNVAQNSSLSVSENGLDVMWGDFDNK